MKKRILCPDCEKDSLFLHETKGVIYVKCQVYECFKMPLQEWKQKHKSLTILSIKNRAKQKSIEVVPPVSVKTKPPENRNETTANKIEKALRQHHIKQEKNIRGNEESKVIFIPSHTEK